MAEGARRRRAGSVGEEPAGGGAEIELTDGSPFDRLPDLDLAHRKALLSFVSGRH
jgi:hypothetical protein